MSHFTALTCSCLLVANILGGRAVAAPLPGAAHSMAAKAAIQPFGGGTACMNNNRLVSHVAYLPVDPKQTEPCGHLLSTDTVLAVHHWDKT